ncbi:hypothetical protein TNCV_2691281 [Trichonephila clavipes]|uniref:Uncharacterized protein n=1 Tax=Trichonephila clavipes TaxID=2585209 RepID=A0A8X6VYK2_TRICX|nr:hypothetical protein TNCV_2691281 [Trichonephila clavipes]
MTAPQIWNRLLQEGHTKRHMDLKSLPLLTSKRTGMLAGRAIVCTAFEYRTKTPIVPLISNLNSQCYNSEMLRSVATLYFRVLGVIFQQYNERPHVAHRVLTYFDLKELNCCSDQL